MREVSYFITHSVLIIILLYDNAKENVVQMYKGIKEMIDD